MAERVLKINDLIRDEVAKIVAKDIDLPEGCLVTIIRADTSDDLTHSKVYFGVFPTQKVPAAIKALNKAIYPIQKKLDKLLKMRPVPKIIFKIDRGREKEQRVGELLEKIKEG